MSFLDITEKDGIVPAEDRHYGPADPIVSLLTQVIADRSVGEIFPEVRQRKTISCAQGAPEN
jgi:hypothetical protein